MARIIPGLQRVVRTTPAWEVVDYQLALAVPKTLGAAAADCPRVEAALMNLDEGVADSQPASAVQKILDAVEADSPRVEVAQKNLVEEEVDYLLEVLGLHSWSQTEERKATCLSLGVSEC